MTSAACIDPDALRKAMALSGTTPSQLAKATGMSLTYIGDLTSGRRLLKRNPALRKKIAAKLDVPQHWIERREVA